MNLNPSYRTELEAILSSGYKCELEALHGFSLTYLLDFLERAILCRDYI